MSTSPQSSLSGASLTRHGKLFNAIVDVCLVYGMDEDTRELEIREEGNLLDVFDTLLQRPVKLQFLQVVAPGQVYPPRGGGRGLMSPTSETNPLLSDSTGPSKKFRMQDLGLAWETVETLHFFMYPEGARLQSTEEEPSLLPMLLTDIEGARSYAIGVKFTRPFFIQKPADSGNYKLIPWTQSLNCPPESKLIYLPTCCVLVSKFPYYSFLKEALSIMYKLLSRDEREDDFWDVIQQYMENMFLVPCPPEGVLSIEVQLASISSPTLLAPPRGDLRLDIRLNKPFLFLSVDDILTVIAALLTEQRLIICSSYYSLPGLIVQCLLTYISPFEWRHPIVPILPVDNIDLLGAPGINIICCHSNMIDTHEFASVSEVVVMKLDEGVVECKLTDSTALPPIPHSAAETFRNKYQLLSQSKFELENIEGVTLPSALEREQARQNYEHKQDTALCALFLELMVNTFDTVSEALLQSRVKYEEVTSQMRPEEQDFYKMATQTDMFSVFMSLRRRKTKRDDFTILAERLKKFHRKASQEDEMTQSIIDSSLFMYPPSDTLKKSWSRKRSSLTASVNVRLSVFGACQSSITEENSSTPSSTNDINRLELPKFEEGPLNRVKFIDKVLETLSDLQQVKATQAVAVYLTGHYLIAKGDILKGMELLCDMQRLNSNLVPPQDTLYKIMSLLSDDEKEQLRGRPSFNQLCPQRGQKQMVRHGTVGLKGPRSSKKALSHSNFQKEMKQEGIANDPESGSSLFTVLSGGLATSIPAELFSIYVETWKQVQKDCASVTLSNTELIKDIKDTPNEEIIAVSCNLRTNFSSHCQVVLTTYRLFAVTSLKTYVFADLRHSLSLILSDLSTTPIFGSKVPGIKIDCAEATKQKTEFYIKFPTVLLREVWYHMIKELQFGWKFATARKDRSILTQAGHHVRMLLALHHCELMEEQTPPRRTKWILKLCSLQSRPVDESVVTTEALLYRINPNIHQSEMATIESTLFVPPSVVGGEGKLWLGMGNGCLRVYDMEVRCFESDLKITDARRSRTVRLSCLLLVGTQVWVGSLSRTIHILDVETLCHVSQLSGLEDAPRDLALSSTEPSLVWTLLLNGILLGFDPETRQRVARIQVPNMDPHTTCSCFTIWREYLWVGTNRGTISIINSLNSDTTGDIFFPGPKHVEIKCLAASDNDEIWCSVHCFPQGPESVFVTVFHPMTHVRRRTYSTLDSRVTYMLPVKNTVWCGTKSGRIYVFSSSGVDTPKVLSAHDDKVRSMAVIEKDLEVLVVSGSGSNDGYANVWRLPQWFKNKKK